MFLNILKALSLFRILMKFLDLLSMSGKECTQFTSYSHIDIQDYVKYAFSSGDSLEHPDICPWKPWSSMIPFSKQLWIQLIVQVVLKTRNKF